MSNDMVVKDKSNRLSDSLFSPELAPHYMQLAGKLATSALVPKAFQGKPQDLFICWAMGYQIGMSPEQAMQCIAVINGRPCMWGDEMLALCMSHQSFIDIQEEPMMDGNTVIGYRCTVKRKDQTPGIGIFTMDMAKKARLLGKPGPWQDYPTRMLQLRARAFALRDKFPDALKGIKSREEVEDYIEAEYKMSDEVPASRTEQLKKDYLTKKGQLDETTVEAPSMDTDIQDQSIASQADADPRQDLLDSIGAQETQAHDTPDALSKEIHRLIAEKSLSDERFEKAMKFYEVSCIEELSDEQARDFIAKLNK